MKVKIETPRVPNFIRIIQGRETTMYPLTAFEDAELEQLVHDWRDALFKNRDRQAAAEKVEGGRVVMSLKKK